MIFARSQLWVQTEKKMRFRSYSLNGFYPLNAVLNVPDE